MAGSTVSWIIWLLRQQDRPLDGEEIFKLLEHKLEKQAMYSMLSYHSRKSLLFLRVQNFTGDPYKYTLNPDKLIPNVLQDELLRIDQELAEKSLPGRIQSAPPKIDAALAERVAAAVRAPDPAPQPAPAATPAPPPFTPGNPYDLVIEAMRKKRAMLIEETAKLDLAIEGVQDVRHSA